MSLADQMLSIVPMAVPEKPAKVWTMGDLPIKLHTRNRVWKYELNGKQGDWTLKYISTQAKMELGQLVMDVALQLPIDQLSLHVEQHRTDDEMRGTVTFAWLAVIDRYTPAEQEK